MIDIGNLVSLRFGGSSTAAIGVDSCPGPTRAMTYFKAGTVGIVVDETDRPFTDEVICLIDEKLYYVSVRFLRKLV